MNIKQYFYRVLIPVILAGCAPASPPAPTATGIPAVTAAASPAPSETPPAAPAPDLGSGVDFAQGDFMLRQLLPDFEKAFHQGYPPQLTGLADADLESFRCTRTYVDQMSASRPVLGYYDEAAKQKRPLADPALIAVVDAINAGATPSGRLVSTITYCETQPGRKIALYSLSPCDPPAGGCTGDPYVGLIDAGQVTSIAGPRGLAVPYVDCQTLLAVSRQGDLYYRCWGGDGPGVGAAVIRLGLTSHDQSTLLACDDISGSATCK